MFQYSIKRKKIKKFRLGTFVFFMIKNNDNRKLNQFSIFDLKRLGTFVFFMIKNNDNRKLNQFSIFDLKRN